MVRSSAPRERTSYNGLFERLRRKEARFSGFKYMEEKGVETYKNGRNICDFGL